VNTPYDVILPCQGAPQALVIINPRVPAERLTATAVGAIVANALIMANSTCDANGAPTVAGGFETYEKDGAPQVRRYSPFRQGGPFTEVAKALNLERLKVPVTTSEPDGPKTTLFRWTAVPPSPLNKLKAPSDAAIRTNIPAARPTRTFTLRWYYSKDEPKPVNITVSSAKGARVVAKRLNLSKVYTTAENIAAHAEDFRAAGLELLDSLLIKGRAVKKAAPKSKPSKEDRAAAKRASALSHKHAEARKRATAPASELAPVSDVSNPAE
jgi:hypothetical protein